MTSIMLVMITPFLVLMMICEQKFSQERDWY